VLRYRLLPSAGASGDGIAGVGTEYSGVGSIGSAASTLQIAPGTGAGAIQGSAVTVPAGSVLVAFVSDLSGSANTITAANSRTARASESGDRFNYAYAFGEWMGIGASVTPTFTATNDSNFIVILFLLTPSGPEPLSEWNVPNVGDSQRRVITGPITLASVLVGANQLTPATGPAGTVINICPITVGTSGSFTITDNGVVVFTIDVGDIVEGVPIPVGKSCLHDITVSSVPVGGEYGVLWEQLGAAEDTIPTSVGAPWGPPG
jgi:hypothetical protein